MSSNQSIDLTKWNNRWGALKEAVDMLTGEVAQTQAQLLILKDTMSSALVQIEYHQITHLLYLLQRMRSFGDSVFAVFRKGFDDEMHLQETFNYPAPYIVSTFLKQLTIDFHVAQQAFSQRRRLDYRYHSYRSEILVHADLLAALSVQPAHKAGLFPDGAPMVITHFQQRLEVRLLPYINALIIGIPHSTPNLDEALMPTEYLAIPHEVGHYLYWHGEIKGEKLYKILGQKLTQDKGMRGNYRRRWLEEIFADTYGALVAGPVSVLAFQDLAWDDLPKFFNRDAQKHPVAAIRPLIQTKALQDAPLEYGATLNALDDHWKQRARQRLNNDVLDEEYSLSARRRDIRKPGADIVKRSREVTSLILDTLPDLVANSKPWTQQLDDAGTPNKLYTAFRNFFVDLQNDLNSNKPQPIQTLIQAPAKLEEIPLALIFEKLANLSEQLEDSKLSVEDVWLNDSIIKYETLIDLKREIAPRIHQTLLNNTDFIGRGIIRRFIVIGKDSKKNTVSEIEAVINAVSVEHKENIKERFLHTIQAIPLAVEKIRYSENDISFDVNIGEEKVTFKRRHIEVKNNLVWISDITGENDILSRMFDDEKVVALFLPAGWTTGGGEKESGTT